MSVAFWSSRDGVIVGGDLQQPDSTLANIVATTGDGGLSWTLGGRLPFPGAAFGVAYVPGEPPGTLVALGPKGSAWSSDAGKTWRPLDDRNYWGLGFAANGVGWLVGPEGRIVKVEVSGVR
jgi:hypothetical protein